MKVVDIKLPDRLHGRARGLAKEDGLSLKEFLAASVSHEIIRRETSNFFREAAKHYSPKSFADALANVADTKPLPEDKIG